MINNLYKGYAKRLIDLIVSLSAFFVFIPVFVITLLLLLWYNNGSAFFFQTRPGKGGRLFKVIKFKTMNDRRSVSGELLSDEERLTAVGKFIRKTSLDELPQLLNVITGDMSLIGPRPLLVEYLSLYNDEQKRRHDVRPGITGWAQVNGRNAISWEQKFKYDIWYVDNLSFMLDIRIAWMTVIKVFRSEGISADGHVTIEKFKG